MAGEHSPCFRIGRLDAHDWHSPIGHGGVRKFAQLLRLGTEVRSARKARGLDGGLETIYSSPMPAYRIERSIELSAPPSEVFKVVSDFSTWTAWSPWLIAEPDAVVRLSGTPRTVGSGYAWEGDVTGSGQMELRQVEPDRHLDIELTFLKPFKSVADVAFDLSPSAAGTRLTWSMGGTLPWFMFWMIPMMKTFLGMDYHRGLLMLKDWIETGKIQSKVTPRDVTSVGPLRMVGVRTSSQVEAVGASAQPAMERCQQLFEHHGLPRDGDAIAVYHRMDVKVGTFEFTIGHVVPESVALPAGSGLQEWRLPAVRAFHVEHVGAYRHLGNGWSVANQLARHRKLKQSKVGAYEVYRHSPKDSAAAELRVDIYLPLKG